MLWTMVILWARVLLPTGVVGEMSHLLGLEYVWSVNDCTSLMTSCRQNMVSQHALQAVTGGINACLEAGSGADTQLEMDAP